jgi:ankyrin repeat protein
MPISCALGFHDWGEDCEKCTRCGKTRANAHDWAGCKCTKCDKVRDAEHDSSNDSTHSRWVHIGGGAYIRESATPSASDSPSSPKQATRDSAESEPARPDKAASAPTESICDICSDEKHDWSKDCEKCARCGQTRSNAHSWTACKCSSCSKTRDEGHDWSKNCEKCAVCGQTRASSHDWSKDCEKCARCGQTRSNAHSWTACKCSSCGKMRDEQHDFLNTELSCIKCGKVANIHAKDAKEGRTLLHVAAERGCREVVEVLIAKGVDVNAKTQLGLTPLHMAALPEIAEMLIARGAEVNAMNAYGLTPLHAAARRRLNNVVEVLITRGAGVNLVGPNGRTPLHVAAIYGEVNLVRMLLAKGADPNALTSDKENALHAAISPAWTGRRDPEVIELLIESGCDPNEHDKCEGWTPLYACSILSDTLAVAAVLLKKGATVDKLTTFGDTALHRAVVEANLPMVRLLLERKANASILSKTFGKTALELAEREARSNSYPGGRDFSQVRDARTKILELLYQYQGGPQNSVSDDTPVVIGYQCPKCGSYNSASCGQVEKGHWRSCIDCGQQFINGE